MHVRLYDELTRPSSVDESTEPLLPGGGTLLQAGLLTLSLTSLSGGIDPWADIPQRYVATTHRDVFESAPRRRRISMAEAVRLCDEIQREAELRRQEAVDREAQAWLEDGILG